MVRIVSLDGIPGAGKSHLLRELERRLGTTGRKVVCLQEPVEEWSKVSDSKGNTLFSLYYGNQQRYALAFQLQVLHTRFELLEKTVNKYKGDSDDVLILTERDLMTDHHIFTRMLYDKGMFEEIEFKLYQQIYESYQRRLTELCGGKEGGWNRRIYLTTPPEVAHRRMMGRGRREELSVSLGYLESVDERHKEVFNRLEVLRVDGEEGSLKRIEEYLEEE